VTGDRARLCLVRAVETSKLKAAVTDRRYREGSCCVRSNAQFRAPWSSGTITGTKRIIGLHSGAQFIICHA